VKSGEEKLRINAEGVPQALSFSPDGKLLLVAGRGRAASAADFVKTFDATSGKPLASITYRGGVASRPLLLPDGKRVLVGTAAGLVLLLRLSDGKELRRMDHRDHVPDLALSPDGLRAASCGHNGRLIKVWDVESGRLIHTFDGHMSAVRGVAFSPDGTRLLSCDAVACVRLWKVGRR
jgi:WD40 repeat protein